MPLALHNLLFWAPRVAGLLMACFLALFALDSFDHGSLAEQLAAFALHLVPSLIVVAIVAVAWRAEWFGAIAFIALAFGYAMMVRWRLAWVAVIGGPLVVVGVLFLASWWDRRGLLKSAP